MYPHNHFSLFPPFPRANKVFVAMSFESRFDDRWKNVIAPAIASVSVDGKLLEPHRVDTSRIGNSILSEILTGISTCRLIVAELTTMGFLDKKPIRNGNVMYEIGIAQARRLPEEVLLFRSDSDGLPFDVTTVRVNKYDPEKEPDHARELVARTIMEALEEIRISCHSAIKYAARGLDSTSWSVLTEAVENNQGTIRTYPTHNMILTIYHGPKNVALGKLLEIGALATKFERSGEKHSGSEPEDRQEAKYTVTRFGRALLEHINSYQADS